MPNHITSRIKITGEPEKVKAFIDEYTTHCPSVPDKSYDGDLIYRNGDNYGWLNENTNIFHQRDKPDAVGIPEGFVQLFTEAWDRFPDFAKIIPPPDTPAYRDEPNQQAVRKLPDHWYNWNTKYWGTKWNCYSCKKISDTEYEFQTAWGRRTRAYTHRFF